MSPSSPWLPLLARELCSFVRCRLSSPAAAARFLGDCVRLWPLKRRWQFRCTPQRRFIELDITEECDLGCPNCDRACGVAPSRKGMSVEQAARFVDESLAFPWEWRFIRVLGGEPTLHPRLQEILAELGRYRRRFSACRFQLYTNGRAGRTREILADLPAWVEVVDSGKTGPDNPFRPFNTAPRDLPEYRDADFTKACWIVERCGMGLNRHGYYPCAPGGAVDRVFGSDVGRKTLREALTRDMADQFRALCPCCGHFARSAFTGTGNVSGQRTSRSWARALEEYRRRPPRLSPYR